MHGGTAACAWHVHCMGTARAPHGRLHAHRVCALHAHRVYLGQTLASYASSSYGDATFTQWVLLALRTAEPEPIRLAAWANLEDIAARLEMPAPPPAALDAWRAPAVSRASSSTAVLEAFERSLLDGRVARADNFLYRLALHHLGAAAFASPPLLHRLLASLPAAIALDLCCCTDLGTPSTLPSLAHAVPAVPEARRLLLRQLAEEKEALALPSALVAALGFGTGV